jgi:hypothetical protein
VAGFSTVAISIGFFVRDARYLGCAIFNQQACPHQTGHSAKSGGNSEPKIEIFQACLACGGPPLTGKN